MKNLLNIRGKFSRLKSIIVALFAGTVLFSCNLAQAFGPLLGLGATVPVFGGLLGVKGASAKATLHQAQQVIVLLKLFLLVATFLLLLGLFTWFVRLYKRAKKKREFERVVALLACLQSDLMVLQTNPSNDELEAKKKSKCKIVSHLLNVLKRKFFIKELNSYLLTRILDSLNRMKENKIALENQVAFVDRLLYRFAFLGK